MALLPIIRFCLVCLALVNIPQFQNSFVRFADATLICNTPECRRLGEFYRTNMNPDGNPCTDFYDYVCHNWGKNNPRPKYEYYWALDGVMQEKVDLYLKNALEEKKVSDDKQVERVKAWFKTCTEIPYLDRFDSVGIKQFLPKVSGGREWPLFSRRKLESFFELPWKIDNHYLKLTGESALFDIIADVDENEIECTTRFSRLVSPYGLLQRFVDWGNSEALTHYKAFLTRIIKSVAPENFKIADDIIDRKITNVIDFREEVREIIIDTVNADDYYLTVEKFQTWIDRETVSQDVAKINVLEDTQAIYKDSFDLYNTTINPNSKVLIRYQYFNKLIKLLKKTPRSVIINHIHLYFLERHLIFNPIMKEDLMKSLMKRFGIYDIVRREPPRWKKCLRSEIMEVSLSKMYIKSHFPPKNKRAVEMLLDEAKRIVSYQISQSNWLGPMTKYKADIKLKNLRASIGNTPIYENNQPISSDKWPMVSPFKVDAQYTPGSNFIHFSASYLQWPIYSPNMPFAVDYGSVMAILGHELYHGFDTNGVTYDPSGNEMKNWWSDRILEKYKEKEKSLREQYSQYNLKELQKENRNSQIDENVTIDTFNEDLADVMGLKVAYIGFKRKLKDKKGFCTVLGGFEEYDCTKLFFIAFGTTFCDASPNHFHEQVLKHNGHSFPSVRVNGAVANLKAFSAAFRCKSDDPLSLKKPFDFWKN